MASFNTKYMINEYETDLGIKIKNLGIKIQTDAPKIAQLYTLRTGGTCGGGIGFKPRRIEAVYEDGRRLIYPVPKISELDDFVAKLTPGLVSNIAPGNGDDEAICIHLLGEEWGSLPPSIAVPKQENPYIVVKGSIKKKAVNYEYESDISKIGKIRLSFAFQVNWVANVIKCQKEGLKDAKDGTGICVGGNSVKPRHLIMSSAYTNDQAAKGKSTGSREVPISEKGSANIKTVAGKIVDCSRCIGYRGESVPNIQLYYGGGIV